MAAITAFVTGATGVQGAATVRALAALSNHSNSITVHALVRDPDSTESRTVASLASISTHLTIKLFKGTFDDVPAMTKAAENCAAAFINVMPARDPSDPESELRHAKNILNALAATPTMKRVAYSSVNGCADPSLPGTFKNISHTHWMYHYWTSKFSCQEAVRMTAESKGWDWTIFQPPYFLTNFLSPTANFMFPDLPKRVIETAFPRDHLQTYVDPNDVGKLAAKVFIAGEKEMKERWSGKKLPLGAANMTIDDVVRVMNTALGLAGEGEGKEVKVVHLSNEEAMERANNGDVFMGSQIFMTDNTSLVNLEEVKRYGVELTGVEDFFTRNRKALKEATGM